MFVVLYVYCTFLGMTKLHVCCVVHVPYMFGTPRSSIAETVES